MPALVGSGSRAAGSGLTVANTYSPTAGNALLLYVQFNAAANPTVGQVAVTDNAAGGSSAYANPIGAFLASGNTGVWLFYCLSVKSGVTTITATISSGTISFNEITIDQLSGFGGYAFDVASVAGTGTSSTTDGWTTGNFTTTQANDFIWGLAAAFSGSGTLSHGTNYTAGNAYGQPLFRLSEYKVAGAAGTDHATWTDTSATDSGFVGAMAFSPSALLMGAMVM